MAPCCSLDQILLEAPSVESSLTPGWMGDPLEFPLFTSAPPTITTTNALTSCARLFTGPSVPYLVERSLRSDVSVWS